MQTGLRQVAALPDPIGAVLSGWRRPNGLQITKTRVPLGVIGIIYESRPNVTVDAAALCLKSGNAALLRGGSEAIHSNVALARALQDALESAGLPRACVQLIESTDRAAARRLMTLNGFVDCLIPRGGASLIKTVVETATVPVIETGTGNCHVYVDKDADLGHGRGDRPERQSPAPLRLQQRGNAAGASGYRRSVPAADRAETAGGGRRSCAPTSAPALCCPRRSKPTEQDWYEEFNALILAVKVVDSLGRRRDPHQHLRHAPFGGDCHRELRRRAGVHRRRGLRRRLCQRLHALHGRL